MPRAAAPSFESLEFRRHLAVDLLITPNPSLTVTDVGEAVPFKGSFSVVNEGTTATSGPVAYRVVYRQRTGDAGSVVTDTTLGAGATRAAAAGNGGGAFVEYTYATPTAILGTEGEVVVILDPSNAIAESNESNNEGVPVFGVRVATTLVGTSVEGTESSDQFLISQSPDAVMIFAYRDGSNYEFLMAAAADVPKLTIDLKGGNDRVGDPNSNGFTFPLEVLGGAGNDVLYGGQGDDTLDGGAGDDALQGAFGADSLLGGDGNDAISGAAGDDYATGDAGNDIVRGDAGADFVGGGAGNDNVGGGDGDDRLAGDPGNDTVRGDGGNDRVAGNAGSDRVWGSAGDDTLLGQGGRDFLYGNEGLDLLIGGAGNDVLSVTAGDAGIDTLSGNAGDDEGYAGTSALLSSIERRRTI